MIVVIMGVAGAGKSTIGSLLAARSGATYVDADSFHSAQNIDKMSHGVPLTDADRAPWLAAIHRRMVEAFDSGENLVVGCSALKQRYRDVLSQAVPVRWVYLKGSPEEIRERLMQRRGHFMSAAMVASQFADLEEPRQAIVVEITLPPEAAVQRILDTLAHDSPHP